MKTIRLPELARELGVHPATLLRWCAAGKGPAHIRTPGGTYIFRRDDIQAWLKTLQGAGLPDADKPA